MTTTSRALCWALVLGLGGFNAAARATNCHEPEEATAHVAPQHDALIPGNFHLVDASTGASVTQDTYNGHLRLVFFGFTHCTTVCPIGLANLARTLDALDADRAEVSALFITTDPDRDSAEVITRYVSNFADDIIGLTGTDDQLADASRAFRTEAIKVQIQSEEVYQMDHPAIFYLMSRDGAFIKTLDSAGDPRELAEQVRAALRPSP